ncbi:hypothetical protein ACVIHF_000625 [Bradyrhizobium sp. USDA 4506]
MEELASIDAGWSSASMACPKRSNIKALAHQDQACPRPITVPGIGPIISSVMVAAIGTGDVFSEGRDFSAWLGLVLKQISTWQSLDAWQSLPARSIRAGGMGSCWSG